MALVPTLVLLLAFSPVFACSCSFPDVRTAVKQADVVFRAKLTQVEYLDPPQRVPHVILKNRTVDVPRRFLATLAVSGVWKGEVGPTIVLHTREGAADCVGFWTEVGVELLVFGNHDVVTPQQPGVLRNPDWSDKVPTGQRITVPGGACTLMSEIKDAKPTLKKLGKPKPPRPPNQ